MDRVGNGWPGTMATPWVEAKLVWPRGCESCVKKMAALRLSNRSTMPLM